MQDRYVGDVGDFGKYGLLRALCRPPAGSESPSLRLGVIWYLVPDENHTNDGKHISYLEPTPLNSQRFRACDPELYDTLQGVVKAGRRSVAEIEASKILGPDTVYFSRPLPYDGIKSPQQRLALRQQWMEEALAAVKGSDLVFVDPDNGLECSVRKQDKNSVKYAYYDEIKRLVEARKSVVIYHHLSRQGDARTQIRTRVDDLQGLFAPLYRTFSIQFHRGSTRAFIALASPSVAPILEGRLDYFVNSAWQHHFTI